jgi:hypothetical protein
MLVLIFGVQLSAQTLQDPQFNLSFTNTVFAQTNNQDNSTEVEVEIESEIAVSKEESEEENKEELEDTNDTENKENEIEVKIYKDIAELKIKINGKEQKRTLLTNDEAYILSFIAEITGLTEDEVKAIWDFEIVVKEVKTKETQDNEESKANKEARMQEKLEAKESERKQKAIERADLIIKKLEEKITNLEKRVQALLAKLEQGKYYGPIPEQTETTKSYSLSFTGSAETIGRAETQDMSGEIFLETLVVGPGTAKFRITGGDLIIGNTIYNIAFGKARATSSGQDSMIIISQVTDTEENITTLKILFDSESAISDIGMEPATVKIMMPQSKIAGHWMLSGLGQMILVE